MSAAHPEQQLQAAQRELERLRAELEHVRAVFHVVLPRRPKP